MPCSSRLVEPAEPAWMHTQRQIVAETLEDNIDFTTAYHPAALYHHLANHAAIQHFLSPAISGYDELARCWPNVKASTSRQTLRDSIVGIASSIVCPLERPDFGFSTRQVVDTHEHALPHLREGANKADLQWSSPDISIRANGASFEYSNILKGGIAYTNVSSCFEVRTDADSAGWTDVQKSHQVGVFARQVFAHQPNRTFVRCLWITETTVTLFHFDRAGVQIASPVNYHDDPATFIRLILGLSSHDESELGFDTSIQWSTRNGFKVGGSITVFPSDGTQPIVYPMIEIQPVFSKASTICGVGTVCWKVLCPYTSRPMLIKDAWRREMSRPEFSLLEQVRGYDGLAQCVTYQEGLGYRVRNVTVEALCMRQIRGPSCAVESGFPVPRLRIGSRTVMEMYGPSVTDFKSEKELLLAFRDAIIGHHNLLTHRGIVHRDISVNNILLAGENARPGFGGVLIDFDNSMHTSELRPLDPFKKGHATGTPPFISISNLRRCGKTYNALPTFHDHLDDLESFFYTFTHILLTMEGPARPRHWVPDMLVQWRQDDPALGADAKLQFLSQPLDMNELPRYWSSACQELYQAFFAFTSKHALIKESYIAMYASSPDVHEAALIALRNEVMQQYGEVVSMFNKALIDLERLECMGRVPRTNSGLNHKDFDCFW